MPETVIDSCSWIQRHLMVRIFCLPIQWRSKQYFFMYRKKCKHQYHPQQPSIFFYSKSKDQDDLGLGIPNWRNRFSNCWIDDPTDTFPSIEHAFQYYKYIYSNRPKEAQRIKIQWNRLSATDVKKIGSKTEFKKRYLHFASGSMEPTKIG